MESVVRSMGDIQTSAGRIGDIIGVIDAIAFQTNILALNAAVEAARAGEQGRGFAVVASEVRALAGRSADAAREIKQLIHSSLGSVQAGTHEVDQTGRIMAEVVQSIAQVAQIMEEITAASSAQSQSVAQVNQSVVHMEQTTQQNAALVEEMAAAALSLSQQAQELVHTVAVFDLGQALEVPESGHRPSQELANSIAACACFAWARTYFAYKCQLVSPAATQWYRPASCGHCCRWRMACAVTSASRSAPVGAPHWSSMTVRRSRSCARRSMVLAKLPPRAA